MPPRLLLVHPLSLMAPQLCDRVGAPKVCGSLRNDLAAHLEHCGDQILSREGSLVMQPSHFSVRPRINHADFKAAERVVLPQRRFPWPVVIRFQPRHDGKFIT